MPLQKEIGGTHHRPMLFKNKSGTIEEHFSLMCRKLVSEAGMN